MGKPFSFCFNHLKNLSPSRWYVFKLEREFDRQFFINTCQDRDMGWIAHIDSPNWINGAGYEPTPMASFIDTIANLQIQYDEYEFIDFGSGKGRALLLASHFPFKAITGVEYSDKLHATAQKNINTYSNSAQKCTKIKSVHEDAQNSLIPEGPAVLYFNQPFNESIFRKVLDRIERSLLKYPRSLIVVYFHPECAHVFDESPLFERWTEGAGGNKKSGNYLFLVYKSLRHDAIKF